MITSIYILNNSLCPKVQLSAQTNDLQYNYLGSNYGNHIVPKKKSTNSKIGKVGSKSMASGNRTPVPDFRVGGVGF